MHGPPLDEDEIETFLHELMRQITNTNATTPFGRELLRIALVGPLGALMRLEKIRNAKDQDET